MTRKIAGVLPVLQMPFSDDDTIEWTTLQREIDWAVGLGVDGVCCAMVSEILRLTTDERLELTERVVEMVAGRVAVIMSVGAESTHQAVSFGHAAKQAGCDAIMAIAPVTTALPEEAQWGYFSQLADQIDLPLIVQDASAYVGQPLSISFCVQLLEEYGPEKILFKPEGAPLGPNISALRDASGGKARILDGSGGILLVDAFRRGIVGTMPGCDLLDAVTLLWRALCDGDEQTAYQVVAPICAIVTLELQAGLDGFLAIEKHILVKRGIFPTARRREPHAWSLDTETQAEVDRLLTHMAAALDSVQPQL